MDWNKFKDKFHLSWHREMEPFIRSNECNKIYNFLKSAKDDIIYPKSKFTFRSFKDADLEKMRVALIFREPYNDMEPDGIPLSCKLAHKVHPLLSTFIDAMEDEFYGLKLDIIKDHHLDYLLEQDIFLYNADLTVYRNKPGSHKHLWKKFTSHVIKILVKRNIPIVFVGEDLRMRFKHLLPPLYTDFLIEDDIFDHVYTWRPNGALLKLEKHLHKNTLIQDIMWVNTDVPF